MFNELLSGQEVNFFIAFIAGFVTFFASCLLPLVPTYLAYLSGVALNSEDASKQRLQIVKVALFFVFGFITSFVLLSLVFNAVSDVFSSFREVVEIVGGFSFIILGLFMLGVFRARIFTRERKLNLATVLLQLKKLCNLFNPKASCWQDGINTKEIFKKYKNFHAFLTGVMFGFAWTPCIGPVLAVILFWSSRVGTTVTGVLLLIAYGMGLGVPFLLVALVFEKIIPLLKKYSKISLYVSYLSGIVIILAGIFMIAGRFRETSITLIHSFFR